MKTGSTNSIFIDVQNLLNSVISDLQKNLVKIPAETTASPEELQDRYLSSETDENFFLLIRTLKYSFEQVNQKNDQLTEFHIRFFIAIAGNLLRNLHKHSKNSREYVFQFLKHLVSLGKTILPLIKDLTLKTDLCYELNYNHAFAMANLGDIQKPEFKLAMETALILRTEDPKMQIYEFGAIQKVTAACSPYIISKHITNPTQLFTLLFELSEKAFNFLGKIVKYKTDLQQRNNIYFQYFFYYLELLLLSQYQEAALTDTLKVRTQFILARFNKFSLSEKMCLIIVQKLMEILEKNLKTITADLGDFFIDISGNFIPDSTSNKHFIVLKQAREKCLALIKGYKKPAIIPQIQMIYHKALAAFETIPLDAKQPYWMDEINKLKLSRSEEYLWKFYYFLLWQKQAVKYIKTHEIELKAKNYNLVLSKIFDYAEITLKDFKEFKGKKPEHLKRYDKSIYDYILTAMNLLSTVRFHNENSFSKNMVNILSQIQQFIIEHLKSSIAEVQASLIVTRIIQLISEDLNHKNILYCNAILADIGIQLCLPHKSKTIRNLHETLLSWKKEQKNKVSISFSRSLNVKLISHHQFLEDFLRQSEMKYQPEQYQNALEILKKFTESPEEKRDTLKLLQPINDIIYFFLERILTLELNNKIDPKAFFINNYFNLIDKFYQFYGQPSHYFGLMLNTKLCQLSYKISQHGRPAEILLIAEQICGYKDAGKEKQYLKLNFLLEIIDKLQLYTTFVIGEKPEVTSKLIEKLLAFSIEILQLYQSMPPDFGKLNNLNRREVYANSLAQGINTIAIAFNHAPAEECQIFFAPMRRLLLELNSELPEKKILATKPFIPLNLERLAIFPLNFLPLYESVYESFCHFSIKKYLEYQEVLKNKAEEEKHKQEQYQLEKILQQKNIEISALKNETRQCQNDEKLVQEQLHTEEKQLIKIIAELEQYQIQLNHNSEQKKHIRLKKFSKKLSVASESIERKYQLDLGKETESFIGATQELDSAIQSISAQIDAIEKKTEEQQTIFNTKQQILKSQKKILQKKQDEEAKKQYELDQLNLQLQFLAHSLETIKEKLDTEQKSLVELQLKLQRITPQPDEACTHLKKYQLNQKNINKLEHELKTTQTIADAEKHAGGLQLRALKEEIRLIEQQMLSVSSTPQARFSFSTSPPGVAFNSESSVFIPVYYV